MSDIAHQELECKLKDDARENASSETIAAENPQPLQAQKKNTLKGMLIMAICCAAPLVLLAAIPALGLTVGWFAGVASSLLSLIAVLACPVGMFLMMRTMMKDKKEGQPSRK